jgi:hypothetical protein
MAATYSVWLKKSPIILRIRKTQFCDAGNGHGRCCRQLTRLDKKNNIELRHRVVVAFFLVVVALLLLLQFHENDRTVLLQVVFDGHRHTSSSVKVCVGSYHERTPTLNGKGCDEKTQ